MTTNLNNILLNPTPSSWCEGICRDLEQFKLFLLDHTLCERKASALAMSFVAKYPDKHALVESMISLAREELDHFHQMFRIIRKYDLELGPDNQDVYVNALLKHCRHGSSERLLDRLIISGLIEARGAERFMLLSEHLSKIESDDTPRFLTLSLEGRVPIATLYKKLADSEQGHFKVFFRLASRFFEESDVITHVDRLRLAEQECLDKVPFTHCLH